MLKIRTAEDDESGRRERELWHDSELRSGNGLISLGVLLYAKLVTIGGDYQSLPTLLYTEVGAVSDAILQHTEVVPTQSEHGDDVATVALLCDVTDCTYMRAVALAAAGVRHVTRQISSNWSKYYAACNLGSLPSMTRATYSSVPLWPVSTHEKP
ncbi:hypothetical protein BDR22DRAFT_829412 [Usnea florida]